MSGDWIADFGTAIGYDGFHDFLESSVCADIKTIGASHGLHSDESLAVYAYSFGGRHGVSPCAMVNGFLRTGLPAGTFVESLIEDLRSAMAKLPRFDGIVYRKLTLPAEVRSRLVPGTLYRDPAFLSASTDPDVFAGQDILLISASRGVMISHMSAFPHEQEVLFLPDTAFRIDRVEQVGSGLLIELTEHSHG